MTSTNIIPLGSTMDALSNVAKIITPPNEAKNAFSLMSKGIILTGTVVIAVIAGREFLQEWTLWRERRTIYNINNNANTIAITKSTTTDKKIN